MKIPLGGCGAKRLARQQWRRRGEKETRAALAAEFMWATESLDESVVAEMLGVSRAAIRRWRTIGVPTLSAAVLQRMQAYVDRVEEQSRVSDSSPAA